MKLVTMRGNLCLRRAITSMVCAAAAARAAGSVPLNIFEPLSAGITSSQFDYFEEDGTISGYTTEDVLAANMLARWASTDSEVRGPKGRRARHRSGLPA